MNRVDIIRRLIELKKIFLEYENIECKQEDVDLINSAIKELSRGDVEILNSLQVANKEIKNENKLLKKENKELKKELELHEWAFEGLRSAYFEKIGEENGD
ncbi:hypothetical protein [Clostridium perfringens]|uniref:hypothetical protein n=1 Tax=Clostridium perfringens TaxID=1502 RepID=UPI001ABADB7A|nr:hypothetical protein [Clostridium perfringens]MBO3389642.1 hypothetical protein [Clostridium perfringens]